MEPLTIGIALSALENWRDLPLLRTLCVLGGFGVFIHVLALTRSKKSPNPHLREDAEGIKKAQNENQRKS